MSDFKYPLPPRKLDLATVIQRLYASEINCGLQSFWDGGLKIWLGDDLNGLNRVEVFDVDDIGRAAAWLDMVARSDYPDSDYAKTGA